MPYTSLLLPPRRDIDDLCIGLYDLHDLDRDVGIRIVFRHDIRLFIVVHCHSHVHRLADVLCGNTADDYAALIEHFGTLGACPDEHRREVEHCALLAERTAIRQNAICILLQLVIVKETERFEAPDQRMKFEFPLFDKLGAARMRRIDHRHLILLGDVIDRSHEAHKMLLVVDIFLSV